MIVFKFLLFKLKKEYQKSNKTKLKIWELIK
jgi:hypothetical protein